MLQVVSRVVAGEEGEKKADELLLQLLTLDGKKTFVGRGGRA